MKDTQVKEAVELFEEVMFYRTERLLRTANNPIWNEYSREQIQVLKQLELTSIGTIRLYKAY